MRRLAKRGNKNLSGHKRHKKVGKIHENDRKKRLDGREVKKFNKSKRNKGKTMPDGGDEEPALGGAESIKQAMKHRERAKEQRKITREMRVAEKRKILHQEPKRLLPLMREPKVEEASDIDLSDESDSEKRPTVRSNAGLRTFSRDLKRVIADSDIVLQVLDARDPLGTRSREAERRVFESGISKRVVLVLNKVDLIPAHIARAWLTYLRQELPTVAFKANTQTQRGRLGRSSKFRPLFNKLPNLGVEGAGTSQGEHEQRISTRQCVGAESLMQLLKNYARIRDVGTQPSGESHAAGTNIHTKLSITVGVIGYPNVGKSSVVNSLRRERVCAVGAKPGVTRSISEIQLDRNIRLLDSPGVVLDSGSHGDADAEAVLRNALEADSAHDPSRMVDAVAAKVGLPKICEHYGLPELASVNEFLVRLARRSGKLKKGGIPDLDAASRRVIQDWQVGAIRYFSVPPTRHQSVLDATLVSTFSREFDAETVYAANDREELTTQSEMETEVRKQPDSDLRQVNESSSIRAPTVQSKVELDTQPVRALWKDTEAGHETKVVRPSESAGLQLNKDAVKRQKRMAKKKRKHERRVNELLSGVTGMQIEQDEASESDSSQISGDFDSESD